MYTGRFPSIFCGNPAKHFTFLKRSSADISFLFIKYQSSDEDELLHCPLDLERIFFDGENLYSYIPWEKIESKRGTFSKVWNLELKEFICLEDWPDEKGLDGYNCNSDDNGESEGKR